MHCACIIQRTGREYTVQSNGIRDFFVSKIIAVITEKEHKVKLILSFLSITNGENFRPKK